MRTFTPKPADINRAWHVIDAEGQVLGKVATEVANLLRGKHKPIWAPHVDTGDHVIVVNAAKLDISARKLADKQYYRHSGYPGGLTHRVARAPRSPVTPSASCASRCGACCRRTVSAGAMIQQAAGLRRPHPPAHRPAAAAPRSPLGVRSRPFVEEAPCPSLSSRPPDAARRPSPACGCAPAPA